MIRVLGISAYYHDSAATLIVDGQIIAAAQEERFSRIKHDPRFPVQAIRFCLEQGQCSLEQLDAIVFYDKPMLKFERLLETYLATAPRGFSSFLRAMPIWLKEKLYLKSVLRHEFRSLIHEQRAKKSGTSIEQQKRQNKKPLVPQLLFTEHHQAHAASAFFPSPFDNAVVLSLDGVGEWATSSIWLGKGNQLQPVKEIHFPHSLGLLYSAFTYYCGFRVNSGEYKLMGLAPYGEPKYVDLIYQHLIDVKNDGSFVLNMKYFDYPAGKRMTNQAFHDLFGAEPIPPDGQVTQRAMDLARSIQQVTEEVVLKIAQHGFELTGCENLCLAGGVALNCVANGRVFKQGPFKNIWIQPAAGDAGGSLGAALQAWYQYFEQPRSVSAFNQTSAQMDAMQGSYLGNQYSDAQIVSMLTEKSIPFESLDEACLCVRVAELIEQGNVVGWFQGRMEFGPRALGNRSILGDPRSQEMQSQMNLKIKQRESFRPFAPAVLAEHVADIFDTDQPSPYMLLVAKIKQQHQLKPSDQELFGIDKLNQLRSTLPAITHVDYSARIQTVHKQTNPLFHRLISAFAERTGMPCVINTSFNVRGEPPVCSPEDALRCFLATEMDYLVMGSILLTKSAQSEVDMAQAKTIKFAMD